MQIPVLIERVAGNGYKARAGEPFGLTAEGPTPDEALRLLRQEVDQRVAAGATLTSIDIPSSEHPWLRWAGTLKGDPLVDEWRQAVAEYRAEIDNDPNIP